ncbi:MAG TPA: terminase family protein [Pseudonocardia sp.]|jgi:hypothetical protein
MTTYLDRAADRLEGKDDSPESRRKQALAQFPSALDLAQHLDYTTVVTPGLEVLAEAMRVAQEDRAGRAVLSMPPQEGKSTLLRWFCLRALVANPDLRIAYISYQAQIARVSGVFVRSMIRTHGEELGLEVSRDKALASEWLLEGHQGGMVSVGIGGALTGRPVDFMIIDDPLAGQKEADSVKILEAQEGWWKAVARTRLTPSASVIVTQTRWSQADIAGNRIAEGWPLTNIPALADGKTPDALDRKPGVWLTSTRGRTESDWLETRKDVGERVFAALYQGRPSPVEGGVYKAAWISRNQVDRAPALVKVLTMVDPADNEGSGDEAGIITAGLGEDGKAYILADDSGHMTVSRWFRVAFLAALRWSAVEVCYEQSLSGLQRRGREAWRDLRRDAMALFEAVFPQGAPAESFPAESDEETIYRAALSLTTGGWEVDAEELEDIKVRLREIWWTVSKIIKLPKTGIPIRAVKPEGSKLMRAKLAAPLVESDRTKFVGSFPLLVHVLTTWQEGMPSPDRMDAFVHLELDLFGHGTGTRVQSGGSVPTSSLNGRAGGGTIPTRTQGRRW